MCRPCSRPKTFSLRTKDTPKYCPMLNPLQICLNMDYSPYDELVLRQLPPFVERATISILVNNGNPGEVTSSGTEVFLVLFLMANCLWGPLLESRLSRNLIGFSCFIHSAQTKMK